MLGEFNIDTDEITPSFNSNSAEPCFISQLDRSSWIRLSQLFWEINIWQKNKVINLIKKESFYIDSVEKDLANNDRCIISTKI